MPMLAALALAQAVAAAPPAKPPPAVGACAWSRLPASDRDQVLAAYHQDRALGLNTLMSMDVTEVLAACAPGSRAPRVFLHRALWAEMTQAGAARELGLDRRVIEAAWTNAPAAARACLHNRLGPAFGAATPDCKDDAEGEIARTLNVSNPDLRLQASIYYLAKAEGEWAEYLIVNTPF